MFDTKELNPLLFPEEESLFSQRPDSHFFFLQKIGFGSVFKKNKLFFPKLKNNLSCIFLRLSRWSGGAESFPAFQQFFFFFMLSNVNPRSLDQISVVIYFKNESMTSWASRCYIQFSLTMFRNLGIRIVVKVFCWFEILEEVRTIKQNC